MVLAVGSGAGSAVVHDGIEVHSGIAGIVQVRIRLHMLGRT